MTSAAMLAFLSGLGLGLSLIVAIGAQNAFVLRQGLRLEHVGAVVTVCVASDVTLIVAGVAGAGAALQRMPQLLQAMRVVGAAFLISYGVLALRRALRRRVQDGPSGGLHASIEAETAGLWPAMGACLMFTWLNPHVYLDTVVLLGSIAAGHGPWRWWFAGGAVTGSLAWFTTLGYAARLLRPLFARPVAWRVLDATIAVVMVSLAASLLVRLE